MHSSTIWKVARPPNYDTNIDLDYPYSEVPHLGENRLAKIPLSLNELIQHVDYWGEGRIVTSKGVSGFSNCYNINHGYRLVSNGPDRDRKIPNRIPIASYTDCDTSSYIKDNTVLNVTVMGARINRSCAKDIARLVNNDIGKVVVFGFDIKSKDITYLSEELHKKGLLYSPDYELPDNLKGVTLFPSFIAYINVSEMKNILYEKIIACDYNAAVTLTKAMSIGDKYKHAINETFLKLIDNHKENCISYAYQLWHGGAKDIVTEYFPTQFKLIFNEEPVTIINNGYNQALKLDANTDSDSDRLAWGDSHDKTSKRVSWKIIPVWEKDEVVFKLYNVDCKMYLKLVYTPDDVGDRKAYGSSASSQARHKYHLLPVFKNNELVFFIISVEYHQALKLAVDIDSYGDRLVWGNAGSPDYNDDRFTWSFAPYSNVPELKKILNEKVSNGDYEVAVDLMKSLSNDDDHKQAIKDIVLNLIANNQSNIMSYAYKFWKSDAKDIVTEYFPTQFKLIFNEELVTIINKGYNQALKLDANTDSDNDRLAWGDSHDKTSKRVIWKIVPVWEKNNVVFKLYNLDCNMYLKLVVTPDDVRDRKAYGSSTSSEARHTYNLLPLFKNNELVFSIMNRGYNQALKMAVHIDSFGDRLVWGNAGSPDYNNDRFTWSFSAYSYVPELKKILNEKVSNGDYEVAVDLMKSLSNDVDHKQAIKDIVLNLIDNNQSNIMFYAYKLWHSGAKDIVTEYFPTQFKLIFNEELVTIINKGYNQALKLDVNTDSDNDRLAWGDSHDKTSKRVIWKIVPVWEKNNVVFKLYNLDCNMYLKLVVTPDDVGDRKAYGSSTSSEARHTYNLLPLFKNNELVFSIINRGYNQALKMAVDVDSYGDRLVWGNAGSSDYNDDRFTWRFSPYSNVPELKKILKVDYSY